jgi:hypothetical protein
MPNDTLEQQRLRTERGLELLAAGSIRFQPEGPGLWHTAGGDGTGHQVTLERCDCDDYMLRGMHLGVRCKHIEALRLTLAALPEAGAERGLNGGVSKSLMDRLGAPFPPEAIHWKPQRVDAQGKRALAVPYLDARDVAERLDEVAGPLGWQVLHQLVGDQLVTGVGLRDPEAGAWTWKWDSGFVGRIAAEEERDGSAADQQRRTDDEEKSRKGTLSDGLKRAAVLWGIGRYLYRLPRVWVAYDPKTRTMLQTPHLPAWATPPAPAEAKKAAAAEAPRPKPPSPAPAQHPAEPARPAQEPAARGEQGGEEKL